MPAWMPILLLACVQRSFLSDVPQIKVRVGRVGGVGLEVSKPAGYPLGRVLVALQKLHRPHPALSSALDVRCLVCASWLLWMSRSDASVRR